VAVEILRAADPEKRDDVARLIEKEGESADQNFVGVLYEQRVLKHVRDADAKKLAWPGLLLREITPEIARNLLAPRCGLPSEKADAAYEALGTEVWIVEKAAGRLRHRPDLRARTLPMMRRHDP